MNQAEKEQYLREYSTLKNAGKPFFPYALAKDSVMAVVVMIVIIFLAAMFGAELGPKADPTTTTYVPRPDWYFYFLFEVLRVMKNVPKFTDMATIGVPTICMILLFLLPFYDRSPERRIERRPVALVAGIDHDLRDGLFDLLGRRHRLAELGRYEAAGKPHRRPEGHLQGRRAGRGPVGLPGLPRDRRQRQQRPRPGPDPHRLDPPPRGDRLDAAQPDGADALLLRSGQATTRRSSRTWSTSCPSCSKGAPAAVTASATPPRDSRRRPRDAPDGDLGPGTLAEPQVRAMFDRIAGVYDRMNAVMTAGLHHQWRRRAADLAALSPGIRALDVATGTGDLAFELARRVAPGGA